MPTPITGGGGSGISSFFQGKEEAAQGATGDSSDSRSSSCSGGTGWHDSGSVRGLKKQQQGQQQQQQRKEGREQGRQVWVLAANSEQVGYSHWKGRGGSEVGGGEGNFFHSLEYFVAVIKA